jgi:hypothetical protein
MLNVAALLSGDGRASIFFLRSVGLDQANALDNDGLDDKERIDRVGCLGD